LPADPPAQLPDADKHTTTGSNYDIVTKLNAAGSAIGSAKIGGSGNDGMNIKDKKNNYNGATGDNLV
jgi:hypothetical protein